MVESPLPIELINFTMGIASIIAWLIGLAYWLGKKFSWIDEKFSGIDKRLDEANEKLSNFADSVKSAVISMNEAIIKFIALKGLITRNESEFLIGEIARLGTTIKANPLRAEELKFIMDVASKKDPDKITIEEIERVADIAKRWWYEEGKEEAFKIFLAATYVKAYLTFKKRE